MVIVALVVAFVSLAILWSFMYSTTDTTTTTPKTSLSTTSTTSISNTTDDTHLVDRPRPSLAHVHGLVAGGSDDFYPGVSSSFGAKW